MRTFIVIYQCIAALAAAWLLAAGSICAMPAWWSNHSLTIACMAMGLLGGSLYCLRAVYLNSCVHDRWDAKWHVWYFIRPGASFISGFVSYLFLKAGLLVLEATTKAEVMPYGYLAIAFIAGYNVDNFLKKIEDIASSVWGINRSRSVDEHDADSRRGNDKGA